MTNKLLELLALLRRSVNAGASTAAKVISSAAASIAKAVGYEERAHLHGRYDVVCVGSDGEVKWEDRVENLVVTVGKNLLLDTVLEGSSYTAASYVGLTQNSPSVAAGDTMASHSGWNEVGSTYDPHYSGTRATPSWSAASSGSKATSAAMSFSITSNGTVGGCFQVYGTGASSTIDNTGGVLLSAGAFTGGDRAVVNGDTLNVSYTLSA